MRGINYKSIKIQCWHRADTPERLKTIVVHVLYDNIK